MTAKRAELETRITGTDASISALGGLDKALQKVGDTSQKVGARVRDLKKEWDKPTSAGSAFAKMGAQIVGQQLSAAADAVTSPAKTSYAQALARAYEYRDATQRVATSTGKTYEAASEQILGTSKRLGLMPGRVQDYGKAVQSLTGDWQGAMGGIEAYQNRALKTNRSLEEFIGTQAEMKTLFGLEATSDVNRFFGTLDAQAQKAGVSAGVAERAFMNASRSFAMLTGARPEQISALTTQVMGNAPNAAVGEANIGEIGGFTQRHLRYIEARMKQQGKLGKSEHLYDDKTGLQRADKFFDVLAFEQQDLRKVYGGKTRGETAGRVYQSGEMSLTGAAAILNLDVAKMRESAKAKGGTDSAALDQWLSSGAGKGEAARGQKDRRDIGLGAAMLPAQDLAVAAGGGAAGIALASAGSIFSKATDTFFSAVELFVGKGGTAAGTAAGAAEGAAVGTTAARAGTAARVVAGVGAGTVGLAAGALLMEGDRAPGSFGQEADVSHRKKELAGAEQYLASMQAPGAMGWVKRHLGSVSSQQEYVSSLRAQVAQDTGATGGAGAAGGEAPHANLQTEADTHATALMKQLESKPLRVFVIQPASAPPGQGQPL